MEERMRGEGQLSMVGAHELSTRHGYLGWVSPSQHTCDDDGE